MEIKLAQIVSELAHHGQFRRDKVTPYYTHPLEVSNRVSEIAKPAALLHDILEDTWLTEEMLWNYGFSSETVYAVKILTKPTDKAYPYLGYIYLVKANAIAREVKIADIRHNLSANPKPEAIKKYKNALKILESK